MKVSLYNRFTCVRNHTGLYIFPDSSAVEQVTVNHKVVGSNPTRGAKMSYECMTFFIVIIGFEPTVQSLVRPRPQQVAPGLSFAKLTC